MKRNAIFPILLAVLTLLLAGLILSDWLPALRGPAPDTGEWHWPYELRPFSRWWLPLLAGVFFWFICAWWLRQPNRKNSTILGLSGLVIGVIALQLGLVYAHRPQVAAELVDRTLANETNGYFPVAAQTTDMAALLRDFPQIMPELPSEHTRTHPPGLILAQWLAIRAGSAASFLAPAVYRLRCTDLWLWEQPAAAAGALGVWAFLPMITAALAIIPLYLIACRLYDENVARLAAMLGVLPALLIFTPTPDQIFAFLSPLILLFWLAAGHHRRPVYAFLAGLLLSAGTFLSLGNGAFVLVLAVHAVWHLHRNSTAPNLKWPAWFLIGLATVWLLYWVGWGVAPWEIARTALRQHYELVASLRRYDWWVLYNLVDLLIFAGPAVVVGFAAVAMKTARSLGRNNRAEAGAVAVALAFLIIVLDLSGSARGEVGRLWLFFMPLLAIFSAAYLMAGKTGPRYILLLLGAQLLLALSIGLAWKPIEAVIVVAERPEMPQPAGPEHELSILFGEMIGLNGFDLDTAQAVPGGALNVTLYWQAFRTADRPYTVFTHLLSPDGELVAQQDNWPVNGQWPPTCWERNELVVDPYRIQLPADLPPGSYSLQVGWYDAAGGTRLLTPEGRDAYILVDNVAVK
jgi:hypothetical protein